MSTSFSRDKIIFTIGRMNPPTSGHQSLIRAMMEEAVCSNVGVVYVILSSSVDKIKNPLKCSRKKELLVGGVFKCGGRLETKMDSRCFDGQGGCGKNSGLSSSGDMYE